MKSEQAPELREKIKELCDEYGIDYVIWAAPYEDDTVPEGTVKPSRLSFYAKQHDQGMNIDSYVKHNWLWRTAMDISNFARGVVDELISSKQLMTIPGENLRALLEEAKSSREARDADKPEAATVEEEVSEK